MWYPCSEVCSGSVVVTAYDSESGRPGSNPEWGGNITMRLRSLHRAYPRLHSSGVVHWVQEQLNIKAVTEACKLIDGCSLALCSATGSVVSSGICHINKVNSIAWLYRDGPFHKIVSFTLHYITLHYITLHYITLHYITLHHITSHHITSHHITSHHITLGIAKSSRQAVWVQKKLIQVIICFKMHQFKKI